MAAGSIPAAAHFLPSSLPRPSPSQSLFQSLFYSSNSVLLASSSSICGYTACGKRKLPLCRAADRRSGSLFISRRSLPIFLASSFLCSFVNAGHPAANAAILEPEDDLELLEKVKNDRKRRIERQQTINSSSKEKAYLQELIFKLSRVGEAIDNNNLSVAGSVLGSSLDTDWVQKANKAFTKLSFSPDEKTEVDRFNSSLASLITAVVRNDVESSKIAFVSSGAALEKWTALTGLTEQLKGL